MQRALTLTELLFQRVKGLSGQGLVALQPGYTVVVTGSQTLRAALLAALTPSPDDARTLRDGEGPTRVGVGLQLAQGGPPHRLLREIGGDRQLQRLDPATRKYVQLSADSLEIDSFVRLECGLPAGDLYQSVFALDAKELPSARGVAASASETPDEVHVAQLRAELAATQQFELSQDRLFKVTERLRELDALVKAAHDTQAQIDDVDAQLARLRFSAEQQRDLTARIRRADAELKKRDEDLAKIATSRRELLDKSGSGAEPFFKSTLFSGGIAAGVVVDAVAVVLRQPAVAFLGLLGFGVALVAVLRWVAADESEEELSLNLNELKDREERIKRAWAEEQAPVKAALRQAGLDHPEELVAQLAQREPLLARQQALSLKLERLRADPQLPGAEREREQLLAEKVTLEAAVGSQGFARPLQQIELALKEALGLAGSQPRRKPGQSDAELPGLLLRRAAELLGQEPDALAAAIATRLGAYLAALTGKQVVAGALDAEGKLTLKAASGRSGPFEGLPPPLRDLVYVALRLTLLERVVQQRRLPVLVDDAFAGFDPPRQALLGKMLKALAAHAQVVHRMAEAPPAGAADAVVQGPK